MGRKSIQSKVKEFLAKKGHPLPKRPCVASVADRIHQASMVVEEVLEMLEGAGISVVVKIDDLTEDMPDGGHRLQMSDLSFVADRKPDMIEFVDGVGDGNYVIVGFASLMGVEVDPIFHEVCDNNLLKFAPGHSIREDGKLIKPPDHQPPNILGLLRVQGYQGEDELDDLEIGDEITFTPHLPGHPTVTGFITEPRWGENGTMVYELVLSVGKVGQRVTVHTSQGSVTKGANTAQWKASPGALAVPYYLPQIESDPKKPFYSMQEIARRYIEEGVHPRKAWLRFVRDTLISPVYRSDRTDEKGFMSAFNRILEEKSDESKREAPAVAADARPEGA